MEEKFELFYTGPFSQWHSSRFVVNGVTYTHAEQYMMHQKALFFGDADVAKKILEADHPREQKSLGRKVKNFDEGKWNQVARDLVYKGNWHKFYQNLGFKAQLLATDGKTLVEASPRDTIWGIGLAASNPKALSRSTWQGKNWLGEVLTLVREDIKNGRYRLSGFNWSGMPPDKKEPLFLRDSEAHPEWSQQG